MCRSTTMTALIEKRGLERRLGRCRRGDLLWAGLVASLFCTLRIDAEDIVLTGAPLPRAGCTKQHQHDQHGVGRSSIPGVVDLAPGRPAAIPSSDSGHPSGMVKAGAGGSTAATAPGQTQQLSRRHHVQEVGVMKTTTAGKKEESDVQLSEENLPKMKNVAILQKEGIIYCPIAKVASTEWKRSLRWMVGIEDWVGDHTNVNSAGKNGLERLVDWGLKGVRWALESERFFRFVVVRDPAERLLSAFLNKCVTDGYMSGRLTLKGAPACAYLTLMPGLFPNTTEATPVTHQRLRDLVERDPEDTFFHFISGIWAEMERKDDACKVSNHHFKPQICFCDLQETLPAFHVFRFSNLSAEAAAFADRIPAPMLPPRAPDREAADVGDLGDSSKVVVGRDGPGGVLEAGEGIGVSSSRRKEIGAFLKERFETSHDTDVKITGAAHRKNLFLSQRVIEIVHKMMRVFKRTEHVYPAHFLFGGKMFKEDFDRLGQHFPVYENESGSVVGDGRAQTT